MVCFQIDHLIDMAKSMNLADPCLKTKQINQSHRNKRISNSPNHLSIPICEQSPSAIIDVIILIAVIGAFWVLLYPFANIFSYTSLELAEELVDVVIEEIVRAPMVFGCLGLSILFAVMALVAITICSDRKCSKRGCRGLCKTAEFDIQLETEESRKKSAVKQGLFELPRDHHRELEAELKKMAPPNGRAVLVFRARCGCSVGRMEVPGPRKSRKVKK